MFFQGHTAYLVSNFAEWIMACSFNSYFFSLIPDFKYYASELNVRSVDADDAGREGLGPAARGAKDAVDRSNEQEALINPRTQRTNYMYV